MISGPSKKYFNLVKIIVIYKNIVILLSIMIILLNKREKITMTLQTNKMKSFIPSTLTTLTAGLLSFQASAFTPEAEDGFYVAGDGGLTLAHKIAELKVKPGINFGGAVGYKLSNYRFEGEFRFLHNKQDLPLVEPNEAFLIRLNSHNHTYAYMGNAYYDFDFLSDKQVRPFLGVGLGYARVTNETKTTKLSAEGETSVTTTERANTFAYQGIAGVAYDFTDNFSANVAYRYLGTSKVKFPGDGTFQSHSFNLGLSYRLGSVF